MKFSARCFFLGAAAAFSAGFASAQIVPAKAPNWYEETGQLIGPKSNAAVPTGRLAPSMTYDPSHTETVLFGGVSETVAGPVSQAETWSWNGTVWTQLFPATTPHAREGGRLVYDPTLSSSVLFAGSYFVERDLMFMLDDTWIWDGANWTQQFPANSPPPRYGFGMTYDAAHDVVVLFGGSDAVNLFNDTWTWDGTNWTQQFPANSPPPRFQPIFTYDAANNNAVMFGGGGETSDLADTWLWDGSNWTQVSPAISPSPRYASAIAYDAAEKRTVLFGGNSTGGTLDDTWTWSGTNWTQLAPLTVPMARFDAASAYDSGHGQWVLYGGGYGNAVGYSFLDSTYLWY